MGNNILLTGTPGCEKTTALMQIVESLKTIKTAGFYTREIRKAKKRIGFNWNCLDGSRGILAHVDINSRYKVGRYGVNITEFENRVVPLLDPERENIDLFVVDEIGKMECFSEKFIKAVRELISSEKKLLASIVLREGNSLTR